MTSKTKKKKKTDYSTKKKTGYRFPEMNEKNYPSPSKYGKKPKVKRVVRVKGERETRKYGKKPKVRRVRGRKK